MAVLIAVGFLSYASMTSLIANGRAVTHTEQVLTELESLMSTVKDAETGQRGFIITNQPEYLAPYTAGVAKRQRHSAESSRIDARQSESSASPG